MSNIIDSIRLSGVTYTLSAETSGGNNVVELTQAQYDALVDKDPTAFYIITDATAGDLTQYWTSAQTQSAITSAVSTKQDTLVSGTNIKTINNESLLGSGNIVIQGGGGSTYTAGRGIKITTGETADTVSFDLPISATTYNDNLIIGDGSNRVNDINNSGKSIVFGRYSRVNAYDSLVGGYNCSNEKGQSQVFGNYSKTKNPYEFGCGRYNNSVTGSSTYGDSGNTLFSVGNGTADNARHNAFEIRQNGDIYCSDGTNDVKLQDTITATAANTTALGGLSIVKLTQAQYNALATKDSSTLYVIVD